MKVLQILPELFSGGVEKGTCELADYLLSQGHQSLVLSHGGSLVESLEAKGSKHIALPVHKKSPLSLRYVPTLRKIFTEEKPDIIHLRSRMPAWLAYLAWRGMEKTRRPALVTTVHGFNSVNAYSKVMTFGQKVICVSESVAHFVKKNYPKIPHERLQVIPRGIDPTIYFPTFEPTEAWKERFFQEFPETANKRILALPGRITQLKGHATFIQLIEKLCERFDDIHGLIIGGTHPKRQAYAQLIEQKARNLPITFTGMRRDMREILSISSIVFSLNEKPETFGRTTLEALSLGIPVLAYAQGGIDEVLSAYLPEGKLAKGDVDMLFSKASTWLSSSPPKPDTHCHFSLQHMLERTTQLYEKLLPSQ